MLLTGYKFLEVGVVDGNRLYQGCHLTCTHTFFLSYQGDIWYMGSAYIAVKY